jgi:hypothetical protein
MNRAAVVFVLVLLAASAFAQGELSTKSKKAIELYTQADNFRVRGQYAEAIEFVESGA